MFTCKMFRLFTNKTSGRTKTADTSRGPLELKLPYKMDDCHKRQKGTLLVACSIRFSNQTNKQNPELAAIDKRNRICTLQTFPCYFRLMFCKYKRDVESKLNSTV